MNAEKAIKVMLDILTYVKPGDPPEEHKAIQIGIEGLVRIESARVTGHPVSVDPLPSETDV